MKKVFKEGQVYTSIWQTGRTLTEQLHMHLNNTCTYLKRDQTESNLLTFTLITLTSATCTLADSHFVGSGDSDLSYSYSRSAF